MKPAGRTTATTLVLTAACGLLSATAPASAAVNCASPVYKRQFYANTTFSGKPKKTDCDSAINENWGAGAPAKGLPKDKFGVRWTVTRNFGSGGPFAFAVAVQDGIRVYLDGKRKVDLWKNVSSTVSRTVNVTIPSGTHTLRVDYVNWTGRANVKFAYTPRTSASVDKVRPLAPTGLAVSYDKNTRKARATWTKNKEMDLAGYRLYRRPKGNGSWTRLTTTTATSATDTPPPTGQVFSYQVRAYDKAGSESTGSADRPVTTVDRTPPAAPFLELDICAEDDKVAGPELVTTAANAADIVEYEAQRRNPATGAWTTVHTGARGPFCDHGQPADGSTATYRGRARDAAGNWSAYSSATTFRLFDAIPPAPPAGARVEYRSGVPHLMWKADSDAARYEVFQLDPATGAWLKAFGATAATTGTDVVPRQQVPSADVYRYAVRALDAAGNASAPSEITLRMADRPEPTEPYMLRAQAHQKGVELNWRSSDPWSAGNDHHPAYRIVRTNPATGESTTIEQCSPSDTDGPLQPPTTWTSGTSGSRDPDYAAWGGVVNASCLEASGASETTYQYRIVAVDRYGHTSAPSAPVTATTQDTVRPAPVVGLRAETVPMGVRLSWSPPADDDILGYGVWQGVRDPDTGETVWRSNCHGGTSMADTEVVCPTLLDGREHVYKVAAYDMISWTDGPDFWNPAGITVALPDSRPPGWSGTTVDVAQYPQLYVSCGTGLNYTPCGDWTDYRWERWDPAPASWTTLSTGKVSADAPGTYSDAEVHEALFDLYYYRAVYSDPDGNEQVVRERAYGIWANWL
ncbi:PA14 domain-containing protein [Streptomyces sp. NPDC017179]|uniref:PA14 domain-containing protein n=1 Tax=Streptomyces sp. NPDC017179 TaxID=3364979 RepID=UPI003787EFC8